MNWHPEAKRVLYSDAGPFIDVPPRIVWHTTEGTSLPVYAGGQPHFTFDPRTNELHQHIPLNRAAKTLKHPAGTVETNRANAIQVELRGYAKDTPTWPPLYYERIAKLARWIETNAGVPSVATVPFAVGVPRFTPGAWLAYTGHCGHQHVPYNDHWDPGAFRINEILAYGGSERKLKLWERRHRITHARAKRVGWPLWLRQRARKLHQLIAREEARA